jgi:hypothetical protein
MGGINAVNTRKNYFNFNFLKPFFDSMTQIRDITQNNRNRDTSLEVGRGRFEGAELNN